MRKFAAFLILQILARPDSSAAKPASHTLRGNFAESQTVVVGTLLTAERIAEIRMAGSRPRGYPSALPSYACEYKLKTHHYIKGEQADWPDVISVAMYSHRSDCGLDSVWGRKGPVKMAVWFLREEGGRHRSVVDNSTTVLAIGGYSIETVQKMRRMSDARSQLALLLLTPGTVYDVQLFADASFGLTTDILGLCGWEGYIRVMRELYSSGSKEFREQLCLILSRNAMCVSCAETAARSLRGAQDEVRYPYLKLEVLLKFERNELRWLDVASPEELHRGSPFLEPAEIRNLLIRDACSSASELQRRARSLLARFYGISPQDLPCAPCN